MLQALCSMFPQAPIYAAVYDRNATGGVFHGREVRTSFLQNIPLVKRYHHAFSPLMPLAFEQFDLSAFDVVFSVAASFAKGIITKPHTRHICYCLTPPRFLWDDSQRYVQEFAYPRIFKSLVPPLLSYLRIWDRQAAVRVDEFIAISDFVRQRISKYYRRDAHVIYPPVQISRFYLAGRIDEYYLMVGRLVTYKRFDAAVRVFTELGWPLKIVGTGVEYVRLKRIAGPNIEFLGLVSDDRLADLYAHARAVVFPQEEDFGIVPLEAMASGRPVIAYRGGGAIETIIKETGVFFDEQTDESLRNALLQFDPMMFSPHICRTQAEKFDISIFKEKVLNVLKTETNS